MQHRQGDGYSFSITLSRIHKKTSQKESARLEPHPPYVLPSVLEARHWGATYALYRVSVSRFHGRKAVADTSGLISSVTGFSSIEYFLLGLGSTGIRWLMSTRAQPNIRNGCTTPTLSRLAKLSINARQRPLRRKKALLREAIPPKEGRLSPVNLRMPQKQRWRVLSATWSRVASRRYANSNETRNDRLIRLIGHSFGPEFRCRSRCHNRRGSARASPATHHIGLHDCTSSQRDSGVITSVAHCVCVTTIEPAPTGLHRVSHPASSGM